MLMLAFVSLVLLAAAPAPKSWDFKTGPTPKVSVSNVAGSVSIEVPSIETEPATLETDTLGVGPVLKSQLFGAGAAARRTSDTKASMSILQRVSGRPSTAWAPAPFHLMRRKSPLRPSRRQWAFA